MPGMIGALGIDRLSVEERMDLAEEIWDSIAAERDMPDLTEEQKREIDRRLAAHAANPGNVIPWDVVKAEAQARPRR